jgi:translation initiation factor IF-2
MASRVRVHEVAKDLEIDSKTVIKALNELGIPVKNHMAALDPAAVEAVKTKLSQKTTRPVLDPKVVASPSASKKVDEVESRRGSQAGRQSGASRQSQASRQPASRPVRQSNAPGQSQQPEKRQKPQSQQSQGTQQVPGRQAQFQRLSGQVSQRPTSRTERQAGHDVQSRYDGSGNERGSQGDRNTRYRKSSGRGGRGQGRGTGSRGGRPDRQAVTGARRVTVQGPIPVRELAPLLGVPVATVLRTLMTIGTLISINQTVPPEIAVKVAEKLGCVVTIKEPEKSQEQVIAEELQRPDDVEALVPRPPVVTVMGHVDHGKTSLLDAIRDTNVTAREAGGITQHIGASVIEHEGQELIFLDTPGHEAFTAMRARGAKVTDVAVLVVAADDGVMPQTIEAINHAKDAEVPIVVALNKIDKPSVNLDRVKQQLSDAGLIPEEWGGDTVVVPVSAKTGEGIDDLLEMIVLVAEMQEIKTDPTRKGRGYIIESLMDKGRGPVATALIRSGFLNVGDVIITDTTWGRIRAMYDGRGRQIKQAGPATPVEIVGLESIPQAGDQFLVVDDERVAKDVTERRLLERRQQEMGSTSRMTLEDFFKKEEADQRMDLKVIIKSDVQGSLEAIVQALGKIKGDEVTMSVIHQGVGAIIESDIMLAKASDAIVLGFNVRPDAGARSMAEAESVEIRTYRVIYDLLDDVQSLLKGLLKPKIEEVVLGRAEVRQIFHVPRVGTVAGCHVSEGKVSRQANIRLIRDGVVVYEGRMSSLKRFKDDVSEVSQGYECGIGLERFQDIKPGDIIEAFTEKEVEPA